MQLRTLFASSLIYLVNSTYAQVAEGDQWKLPPSDDGVSHYTGRLPKENHSGDDEEFWTGRLPSEHEENIPHPSQAAFMEDEEPYYEHEEFGDLIPTESHKIDDDIFFTGLKPSQHKQHIPHASQEPFMRNGPSEHDLNIPHPTQAPFMADEDPFYDINIQEEIALPSIEYEALAVSSTTNENPWGTGLGPSQHEQQIPHKYQDQYMQNGPSEHDLGISHSTQKEFMEDPQPSKHEQHISHPSQAAFMEDSYEEDYDIYIEEEEEYDVEYYDMVADADDFFSAHLDYYLMSDNDFYQKWGYNEDPITVWQSVSDRIDIELGWIFKENYSEYKQSDYFEWFDAIVSGLESLDVFIGRQYGNAFKTFQETIEEYEARLMEAQQYAPNYSEQDWKDLRSEIYKGVTRLNELARDSRLVAAGQLQQSYAKQTMAWDVVQAHLDKLGKQTHEKLEQLAVAQQEASGLPVWAACAITGLSVALLFISCIGCGVIRNQRRKMKQMELTYQPEAVTQRDHTTARQGTMPEPVVPIKAIIGSDNNDQDGAVGIKQDKKLKEACKAASTDSNDLEAAGSKLGPVRSINKFDSLTPANENFQANAKKMARGDTQNLFKLGTQDSLKV